MLFTSLSFRMSIREPDPELRFSRFLTLSTMACWYLSSSIGSCAFCCCRSLPNKFQVSHERVLFSARKSELNFTLHTPFQNFFTWFKRNPLAGFFGRSDKNSRPKNSSWKKLEKNSKKLKQIIKKLKILLTRISFSPKISYNRFCTKN